MAPTVSIVTVYYNSPEDVLALQKSMQMHLPLDEIEWIVADNNSREDLSQELPGVVYVRLPDNYGFSKANNLAVQKASAPNLFFVNPDCMFVENCLPPLIDALKEAGVTGPRVLNENGSIQLSFGPFLSIRNEFHQRRRIRSEYSVEVQSWMAETGEAHADYVSGCALMISAELYRGIGGFDENFFLYEEDVDLCKRVYDAGFKIRYVPSAVIVHKRNQTVRLDQQRSRKEYRKSQLYYYKKHHGWFQNLLLKLYLLLRT